MIGYENIKNKKELFKNLYENKDKYIRYKKSALKMSDSCLMLPIRDTFEAEKGLQTNYIDNIESGIIKRTIIGNTYYWMDSHDDVHVGNTFRKSINDNKNNFGFQVDHENTVMGEVGYFDSVYERQVLWTDLEIEKQGMTTVLLADANIYNRKNEKVFNDYLNNEITQHSVGMFYINIELAMNSNDIEFKKNKALFDKHIELIGNAYKAYEKGFFWAVSEAKLIEISAVKRASNELTNTIENINEVANVAPFNIESLGKAVESSFLESQKFMQNIKTINYFTKN
jgi:hypothetical protein